MRKNIQWLLGTTILLFPMVLVLDFTYITKFMLWFLWATWSIIIALTYTIIWRESVDCRCLEKTPARVSGILHRIDEE